MGHWGYTVTDTPTAVESTGQEVDCITIGGLMDEHGIENIDLLKMDIEGAEYDVLDGMLASDIRPKQLLVEFHHRFSSIGLEATRDMIRRLEEAGYRIFAVSTVGREVSFLHAPDRGS